MKTTALGILGLSILALPALSFAAGVALYNGGLGQAAGSPQSFGVAVCNGGAKTVNQSVPVSIATGEQTADVTSVAPIAAGACAYTYLGYDQLGMQAGQTYQVTVTIDQAHTVIANTDNQTVYSVTVPGAPTAAATPATGTNQTANINAQSGNFFTMIVNWLSSLFGGK